MSGKAAKQTNGEKGAASSTADVTGRSSPAKDELKREEDHTATITHTVLEDFDRVAKTLVEREDGVTDTVAAVAAANAACRAHEVAMQKAMRTHEQVLVKLDRQREAAIAAQEESHANTVRETARLEYDLLRAKRAELATKWEVEKLEKARIDLRKVREDTRRKALLFAEKTGTSKLPRPEWRLSAGERGDAALRENLHRDGATTAVATFVSASASAPVGETAGNPDLSRVINDTQRALSKEKSDQFSEFLRLKRAQPSASAEEIREFMAMESNGRSRNDDGYGKRKQGQRGYRN